METRTIECKKNEYWVRMNRENYIKQISDALALLRLQVENRNSQQLYDIDSFTEDVFKGLLNRVYGYDLENLNIQKKSMPAIDLGDKNSSVAVQVTSENSSTKIIETIDKFTDIKLYDEYKRLLILIVNKKKNYRGEFENRSLYFKTEILDIDDLLTHIRGLETPLLEKIANFLENELEANKKHGGYTGQVSESNEVETIMRLIEFLSNYENKNIDSKPEEEPDPEKKIYKRFSDHSTFLESLYRERVPIYGEALDIAVKTMGLHLGKIIKIRSYLKEKSDETLTECDDNPKMALDALSDYFELKISSQGIKYDHGAIKFYLIDELIKCNVFPNPPAGGAAND
ncbi:MAG: hypothetical protein QG657_2264 [Acidobacteriota bacterium]|nr:hypothetical protein [Acidobacteriota bacterium]